MLNSKFIKIIIVVTIILLIAFAFVFIQKNNNANNTENMSNSTSTLTGVNGRPVLNTNVSNPNVTAGDDTPVGNSRNGTNGNPYEYEGSGPEDVLGAKIKKILFDWNITKDQNSLREAVSLSEGTDNEVIFSAWTDFMKADSAELVKIINTSTDINKTKKTVATIFQWFIELSGEYEKLPSGKRQQITNQYNQLK